MSALTPLQRGGAAIERMLPDAWSEALTDEMWCDVARRAIEAALVDDGCFEGLVNAIEAGMRVSGIRNARAAAVFAMEYLLQQPPQAGAGAA